MPKYTYRQEMTLVIVQSIADYHKLRIESTPEGQFDYVFHIGHPFGRVRLGTVAEIKELTVRGLLDLFQHALNYSKVEEIEEMKDAEESVSSSGDITRE